MVAIGGAGAMHSHSTTC